MLPCTNSFRHAPFRTLRACSFPVSKAGRNVPGNARHVPPETPFSNTRQWVGSLNSPQWAVVYLEKALQTAHQEKAHEKALDKNVFPVKDRLSVSASCVYVGGLVSLSLSLSVSLSLSLALYPPLFLYNILSFDFF